jgi:hypothetical protein
MTPGVAAALRPPPHPPEEASRIGPLVSFTRSNLTVRWGSVFHCLACEVPVRWSCRTGVCHNFETGLISRSVIYPPDPVEPPADGNVLICCSQPRDDVALDLRFYPGTSSRLVEKQNGASNNGGPADLSALVFCGRASRKWAEMCPGTDISLPDQAQPVVSTCRTLAGIVLLPIRGLRRPASLVPDQSHETFVLVVLVVAVEERRAGVIGDKINFRCGEARHVQRVLHHP